MLFASVLSDFVTIWICDGDEQARLMGFSRCYNWIPLRQHKDTVLRAAVISTIYYVKLI